MRQVIRIGVEPKEEKALKPIKLTHLLDTDCGWNDNKDKVKLLSDEVVTYLGHCSEDGDIFMTECASGYIRIYRGDLNDGVY